MAEILPIRRARPLEPAEHPIPRPPRGLSPESRRIWQAITKKWALDPAALPLLVTALESLDRYQVAADALRRDGPTVTDPKGKVCTHPAHVVAKDNLQAFRQLFRQLNLEVPKHA